MRPPRRAAGLVVRCAFAIAAVLTAACAGGEATGFSGDVQVLLARGEAYARSLPARSSADLSAEDVIALGYLERARLGIGSPFRLVDYALRDPDLSAETRERVAYAILSLTLAGETYQVDPRVLEPTRFFGLQPWARTGAAQLSLITRIVDGAASPTSGERAVRLGYRIAEADRTVSGVPHGAVAQVAALVADRRRAMSDARTMLRTAARSGADPLALLQAWRRATRFSVEAPSLVPLRVAEEEAIARAAPLLARSLEGLALRLISPGVNKPGGEEMTTGGYLPGDLGDRLLALAEARDYPAQAPVAVAVSIMREGLVGRPELSEHERIDRAAFAGSAYNEERFVASYAKLRAASDRPDIRVALIPLQISTFMRAWAQEEPWFPGDPAPAARDLVGRFGLTAIEFGPGVPDRWRPYALLSLARGLSDLQRVLPTASVRGLTIHFGPVPRGGRALALHDPRTRTLYLPVESGAGTLAHEVAHDLDWQLARQRYGVRGGYATDLAVRRGAGDRLATSLEGLVAAFRRPGADTLIDPHDSRPAEVFARGSDWFIASALAREGRTGGYLSSYQDPALTGYGSTRGPDIGGGAVPALLSILDAIAPVADETRTWARADLGPTRTLNPSELASAVLLAGQELPAAERFPRIAAARDRSLSAVTAETCRFSSAEGMRRLATAQRELILHSTASAARGAAIDAVRELAASRLGAGDQRVERWLTWRIHGGPEPADSALVELAPALEDLLHHAEILARERTTPTASPFRPSGPVAICGGNPFAASTGRARAAFVDPAFTDSARAVPFRF